ncbi:M48 family metallopeptidase [Sabulicella rubraurantiaca]|uniref:M48 family metallopeptidase n=1 Tax=Sabulicella rubraurantiaca TaxID=2811429 RepID=UPI001A9708EA|nr:SprT family zinc-dependent metalloprotease [Sabulicella rubraurantiaca]
MTETELVPLRRDPLLPASPCPVLWRRSARARRVSLRVDPVAGAAVVTLPRRASRAQGLRLLEEHAAWVLRQLDGLTPALELRDGATVPIGGVPHLIRHAPDRTGGAFLEDGVLFVTGAAEFLPRRTERFLRAEALRRIGAAAMRYAGQLGMRPKAIRLKDTRTRWGSCAPDRTLSFTWRLVMAPDWVLDYVVAHEVAHLKEMNHSDRFWAVCEALTPHRAEATSWLKRHGPALMRVG